MRKTNLFGATILTMAASTYALTAVAQTAAPAPAPMATPAPAAPVVAPEPAPAPAAATPTPDAAPAPDATPAPNATAPAPDASAAKPAKTHTKHHAMIHKGKLAPTKAGDKAVEDLNDASLNAAKTGKPFTAPATPDAAKVEAHKSMPMHKHMHHMAKKTDAAAPADATTPAAPDAATPPADTSGK